MKDILRANVVILFILSFVFLFEEVASAITPITIKINASLDFGPVPEILSSSVWIGHSSGKDVYSLNKFFKENKPATVQLSIPLGGTDYEDFTKKLKEYLNNKGVSIIIEKVREYDSTLIVGFDPAPMRSWLSSRRGDERKILRGGGFTVEQTSPPVNYELWGKVVKYTLNYFKNILGIKNLGFYVGHEPNRDWLGSEESFFKYYGYAVNAAKEVNKTIKVGGIGSWHIKGVKLECDSVKYASYIQDLCKQEGGWADPNGEPLTKNFIKYVGKHNIPLDFVNWHSFGEIPERFPEVANLIRGWLKEIGIREKEVKLYPSDWTYWNGSYPADYLDTQESAAYILTALYYMWKGGIDWHGHDFNVFDGSLEKTTKKVRQDSTFIGDWSMFTEGGRVGGGIAKPMYNAFRALSIATHEEGGGIPSLISTEFPEGENVVAFSTLTNDKRKISVIVANFIPHAGERLNRYILETLKTRVGFLKDEIELLRECMKESKGRGIDEEKIFWERKNKLISTLEDPKKIEALNFIAKAYISINNKKDFDIPKDFKYPETKKIADTFRSILDASTQQKQIKIYFANVPFDGKARFTTYRIDSTHSNACSFNKKTEPVSTVTLCGIGGEIDRAVWNARQEAEVDGEDSAKRYLLNKGYTHEEISNFIKILKKHGPNLHKYMDYKSLSPEKKNDLTTAFKKYREIRRETYYNKILNINNYKEISLEGSQEQKEIEITKGTYAVSISAEPNSIGLLTLERN